MEWQSNKTTILSGQESKNEEAPLSLSSMQLRALTQTVVARTGSLRLNRCGALVIAVLIAIPMWLLIILLSPFDAYVSAKAACARIEIR